jgi:hypothetical protein
MQDAHRFNLRGWLLWLAGFLSFPIAGLAAGAVVGRIDDAKRAVRGLADHQVLYIRHYGHDRQQDIHLHLAPSDTRS